MACSGTALPFFYNSRRADIHRRFVTFLVFTAASTKMSSGTLRRVVWLKQNDVWDMFPDYTAQRLRQQSSSESEISGFTAARMKFRVLWYVLPYSQFDVDRRFRSHRPDDGGSTHLWNVGRHRIENTAVHPRRIWTSYLQKGLLTLAYRCLARHTMDTRQMNYAGNERYSTRKFVIYKYGSDLGNRLSLVFSIPLQTGSK
jgi:hypothetical protein